MIQIIVYPSTLTVQIDALEGRFAYATGVRSSTPHDVLRKLSSQLSSIEQVISVGSSRGLQGKADALVAAARVRAGISNGGAHSGVDSSIDPGSLASAYSVLSEYAEGLEKMQGVVKRCARDLVVLEELKGSKNGD